MINRIHLKLALLFCSITLLSTTSLANTQALGQFSQLNNAGVLVTDTAGNVLTAKRAEDHFVPASTTKLVTGWLALRHWGAEHRFTTNFYFDDSNKTLWVKGSGDPFLVSEELLVIAKNLRQRGLTNITTVAVDNSLFQNGLILPGTSKTNNPYDAVPSAVAANFNTVNLKKVNGNVVSAEAQTPLTPFAMRMATRFKSGKLRVNTGTKTRDAGLYFAELLAALLRAENVQVGDNIIFGKTPELPITYTHTNSKNLAEVVKPMMKYSTNFIANQLILMLAVEKHGAPATAKKVRDTMHQELFAEFGWSDFEMQDGAGLSRANQLKPSQLIDLLGAFKPWKDLLPEVETGVYAKSGTLTGVSTLAGYLVVNGEWQPFALMMNQSVPAKLRNRIAQELRNSL